MPCKVFDKNKFKGLLHYICHKADVGDLGATKLNKILWYSDSFSYLLTGQPITGETYRKQEYGPVPSHILPVIEELEFEGAVQRGCSDFHGHKKTDYNCVSDPDVSLFDSIELDIVNQLIEIVCKKHTATSISEASHDKIWELAEKGEEIPLYTTLVSKIEKADQDAIDWATSVLS